MAIPIPDDQPLGGIFEKENSCPPLVIVSRLGYDGGGWYVLYTFLLGERNGTVHYILGTDLTKDQAEEKLRRESANYDYKAMRAFLEAVRLDVMH